MVELNVASREAIQDELKRRERIEQDSKIKDFAYEIDRAYRFGKISNICKDIENKGTRAEVTKYYVFVK